MVGKGDIIIMHDNLGNRMKKNYENRTRFKLNRRTPVIMRLDGRAFHTLTKKCDKPFDETFHEVMDLTAETVMRQIQGAKLAYIQSDEISILITDYDKLETEAWFDYNVQKMCSIAASVASVQFSKSWGVGTFAEFDCRVFNIPKEEVCNYFIWRQNDWVRNSLQMYTRSFYLHKECHKKGHAAMHEMLHAKGVNWADLDAKWKNGTTIYKEDRVLIHNAHIQFKLHRGYVNRYIYLDDEK